MEKPKILLFDLEISPNLGYTWRKWEQNVIEFKKEWEILSIAWKWVGGKVESLTLPETNCKDDKSLCREIYKLFQKADILIAHNGDSFDIKKAKSRFLFHGFPPTKRLASIDTKKVARNGFSFNSNSLDDLGKHLGLGRKMKHEGFDLWLKCMAGDKAAWKKMKRYNELDVELLGRVYNKLRPWILNHPSLSAFEERPGCPNCGSAHVVKQGVRANVSGLRQQMRCKTCRGWYLTRYQKL